MNISPKFKHGILLLIFGSCLTSCSESETLFSEMNGKKMGVHFTNSVHQDEIFNILSFELLFNGGGVAIDDFNNDGLQDLFFTGNIVDNKLFINKGNLQFQDISERAGINGKGKWSSGVTTVDINGDGLKDIYVCATLSGQSVSRKNMLFINKGLDEDGYPKFEDEAGHYGIDDDGHSTQAVFFDYDHDNDLDLYILTDQLEVRSPNKFYFKRLDGSAPNTDRFYRNNGDHSFSNYSKEAGVQIEGYGLGVHVFDVNEDGWLDIYVANDYLTNDILYVNNGDGTFSNQISKYIKHQSHSSMGCDIADINNDGRPDILTLEMLPLDMKRMKRMWSSGQYSKTVNNEKLGYDFQYMRNMFQVNEGMDEQGNLKFSDLSFYSGIEASEWSWAALFNDYDADGDKDLFISNGIAKDMTDLDFVAFKAQSSMAMNRSAILEALPEHKVPNFFFENTGELKFGDMSHAWGIRKGTFSNGAAYGDLDNDGDLDLVVNNINDNATFLINNSRDINFLKVELQDKFSGAKSLGAKVDVFIADTILSASFMPVRGYISSMQPMLYFGLGHAKRIDSLIIKWADGTFQQLKDITINDVLKIDYNPTKTIDRKSDHDYVFIDESDQLEYRQFESRFIDFNIQPLLPRQYSMMGPSVAAGDIDGNGEVDFVVGGSLKETTSIFYSINGNFELQPIELHDPLLEHEDTGTLLFDADNDDDLDLYVVSGGNEIDANTAGYTDRFYLNKGDGTFIRQNNSIPSLVTSGSCVKGADFDKDGDIDLFVGGRLYPGQYPRPVSSYLLRNETVEKDKVLFHNVSQSSFPDLIDFGMVTDAVWSDFNNDGWMDLVIVGEWTSPRFFTNDQGEFKELIVDGNIGNKKGWWHSIAAGDFDNDGDTDFVAGNLGMNSFYKASENEPLHVFAKDFDQNGGYDAFLATSRGYEDNRLYPLHAWDDVLKQMEFLRKRVLKYEDYANSSIEDLLLPEELKGALNYKATWFYSSYIENKGNGQFEISSLPGAAQVAPVQSIVTLDVNEDDFLDILLVGNDHGGELFGGKYDAFNGLVLYGDGQGNFNPENYSLNGFLVSGDARGLIYYIDQHHSIKILASQNRDKLRQFSFQKERAIISLHSLDAWALIKFEDDSSRRVELGYGHAANAQSSRHLILPSDYKEVRILDSKGIVRLTQSSDNN